MDVLHYLQQHWHELVGWAAAAAAAWLATAAVGKPLVQFAADRMAVLQALEKHWTVGQMASEEQARAALDAIGTASATLQAYTHPSSPDNHDAGGRDSFVLGWETLLSPPK